jgi:small subunit ribosomal protein S20
MPNTKSAKKDLRQTKRKNLKNSAEKNKIKDLLKKTLKAVEAGQADQVKELSRQFQKAVDKAVRAGWLKKNTASRRKSRLALKIKKSSKK